MWRQILIDDWHLVRDGENRGRDLGWCETMQAAAEPAGVPGTIQQTFPGYHGVAWYYHRFTPRYPITNTERYVLRFNAVDYLAQVWVNGAAVGEHEGGECPFEFDVTSAMNPRSENLLAVRVLNPTEEPIDGIVLSETPHRNKALGAYLPGQSFNSGGIVRSVELVAVASVRITDAFVESDCQNGEVRVTATLANASSDDVNTTLSVHVVPFASPESELSLSVRVSASETRTVTAKGTVDTIRRWELHDPFLYRADVTLRDVGGGLLSQKSIRFGFRDFRVVDGYFALNGRRLFLRSTHTGNHVPAGAVVPLEPDLARLDLVYAKASGFNCVRFIAGMPTPEQLEMCDEIGLMVYEECHAAWCLQDSPKMTERFDRAVREMIFRDRNHPCITIWGLLNETFDGPVFRHAVDALGLVRELDSTRLVLLSSGRWDAQLSIGSVSNPGSDQWECLWGSEEESPEPVLGKHNSEIGGFFESVGDVHFYPKMPQSDDTRTLLRSLGSDSKPVFLSEYGVGSLMNVVGENRHFERIGGRRDLEDVDLIRSMAERFVEDWRKFRLDGVYSFPEDFLRASQEHHVRQRILGLDLIRANPRICGYNLTGMLDHAMTGEGLWTFWRDWKPGMFDAIRDCFSSVRLCLFVEPRHVYSGRRFRIEAVLANEDALKPGSYPIRARILGPSGVVWEKQTTLTLSSNEGSELAPLAFPLLDEELSLDGESGAYEFAVEVEGGCAPSGGRLDFHVTNEAEITRLSNTAITVWGVDHGVESWLSDHGARLSEFDPKPSSQREIILVGRQPRGEAASWRSLAEKMARGAVVIFGSDRSPRREGLPPQDSPSAEAKSEAAWLPLTIKGEWVANHDWLYHKECVANRHPIFDGFDAGLMDWDFYGRVIGHSFFQGQRVPDEVAAAAFVVGYPRPGGYSSGVLVGVYRFGNGRFVINSLPILQNVGQEPAADMLLLNMIRYAAEHVKGEVGDLPRDFEEQLGAIGY